MVMQRLSALINSKVQAVVRQVMVRFMSARLPLYIVNEYPKSGGSWLGQMLGEALGVPFPRNCMPAIRSSIMHDHYYHSWGMKNVVVLFRDGRDVMVSWYHHCLFYNERGNSRLVDIVRRDLPFNDYDNVSENLPAFIEYAFTRQKHPDFSWSEFVRKWYGKQNVVYCRYEDLRVRTAEELRRVVFDLSGTELEPAIAESIADRFSFSRQAGRTPGEENKSSFLRKGLVGDWKNHFNEEARKLFDQYAGKELIMLGYETDHQWINESPDDLKQ